MLAITILWQAGEDSLLPLLHGGDPDIPSLDNLAWE